MASKALIMYCSTSRGPHDTTSSIRSWKQNKYIVPLAAAHNTINVQPARIHELEAVDAWSAAEIDASLIRCSPFVWTTGKVLHPYAHHHHPAYKVVKAACDEWLVGVAQPTSHEGADFLTASGIPWLCCMAFPPSTPQERLLRISKLVAWMTLVDDLDDKISPRSCSNVADDRHTRIMSSLVSSQNAAAAACGELNGRDDRLLLALSELWQEMTSDMPSSLQSRLIAAYKEALHASHAQAVFRKARRLPSTLQEFVAHRRPSSLYPTGIALLQYALDIELDHATLEHPLIHQLITAVVDYCSWCNDLFSCQVEISHREFFNLPSLLFCSTSSSASTASGHHGPSSSMYTYPSFQDAIDEAVRMVNAADSLCVSLVAEVDKSELMCNMERPGLRSFIQGLGTWKFAVHKWYAESPRYRKQKKNWTPL